MGFQYSALAINSEMHVNIPRAGGTAALGWIVLVASDALYNGFMPSVLWLSCSRLAINLRAGRNEYGQGQTRSENRSNE